MAKISNNYTALAYHMGTLDRAGHDDGASATIEAVQAHGWLEQTRPALVVGVLRRNRPEELAWLFGEPGQRLGFSLAMDTQPALDIPPLTWALMHGKQTLMARLGELGARFAPVDAQATHPLVHLLNKRGGPAAAVPLALLDQARGLGLDFNGGRELPLTHVFTRRAIFERRPTPDRPALLVSSQVSRKTSHGRYQATTPPLYDPLAWAEALVARGADPRAVDGSGMTLHHRVMYWEAQYAQDDRRPWLAFLARHQALAWEQPDAEGRTPRQMQARSHPVLEAEMRERQAADAPAAPTTRRRFRA